MAFKKISKSGLSTESPQALFRDLKNRSVPGLWDHQSDMLSNYTENAFDKKNVALELPTGSGKTLIGLLIAEYRRRKNGERVVYLCPNKQLVNQVVSQSYSQYGIKTAAFIGSRKNFKRESTEAYRANEVIAVTTYSGLFNTNPFFTDPDIVILDDAHSAENYIPKFWSISIGRSEHKDFYFSLLNCFQHSISESSYRRFKSSHSSSNDLDWIEKVPFPQMVNKLNDLEEIMEKNTQDTELYYSWSILRNHMHCLNIFISHREILIRPYLPPALLHEPFSNAKQRIYMSATLGLSGELERITGVDSIHKLQITGGWEKQGLGRRFFVFPESYFEGEELSKAYVKLVGLSERAVFIVPSGKTADNVKNFFKEKTNHEIFDNNDLRLSKQEFISSSQAIAILANRFDGIDFPGDECRLLFAGGLGRATNLQEMFLINRMAANILFHERIRTRLVQALGRCTRGPVDYAIVCVLGNTAIDELVLDKKVKYYHPELQAELAFGYEQTRALTSLDDFEDNLKIFLKQGSEWSEANEAIISERNQREQLKEADFEKLSQAAIKEVKYQYAFWQKDYTKALSYIESAISCLSGDNLLGYKGFCYYLAGNVSYLAFLEGKPEFENKAQLFYEKAAGCTMSVTWFRSAMETIKKSTDAKDYHLLAKSVENIEKMLCTIGIANRKKLDQKIDLIKNNLAKDGLQFEQGIQDLGELLGFESNNTSESAGPDPWWIIGKELCIVSECKILESSDNALSAKYIRQARTHKDWIKQKIQTLDSNCEIITAIYTNTKKVDPSASAFTEDLYYWNSKEIQAWAEKFFFVLSILRNSFSEPGDIQWREAAMKELIERKLTPEDLIEMIKGQKLADLEVGN